MTGLKHSSQRSSQQSSHTVSELPQRSKTVKIEGKADRTAKGDKFIFLIFRLDKS